MYQRLEEGYWYGPRQYCMERFPLKTHERAFILYQFIAAYLLPVLTISFCYSLMVKRVGQPSVEPVDNNYQVWLFLSFHDVQVDVWFNFTLQVQNTTFEANMNLFLDLMQPVRPKH